MKYCLLTRFDQDTREEESVVSSAFTGGEIHPSRMTIPQNCLVVGRYSVLPFYPELERDLAFRVSRLINSHTQHRFIADIRQWYPLVADVTPATWFDRWDLLDPAEKYVVKGLTNSRKWKWDTHMFADGKENLMKVLYRLYEDAFISEQGVCVRKYVPLKTYDYGLNGLPFTNEWRMFYLGGTLVSHGYYWSTHERENPEDLSQEARQFADEIAARVASHTNFFVLDIAEKADGGWVLIEINDGQMSGLSDIDPTQFYSSLDAALQAYTQTLEV